MTTRPGDHLKSGLDSRVRALHAAGMSQGGIARELAVSRWQVRKSGERLGLSWDTTITEVAVRASAEHARRDRDRLAERYLDLSHDFLDKVEEYTADTNPSHAWEALKSAATATDKLVALHALTARYPVDTAGESMQQAHDNLDAFMAGTLAAVHRIHPEKNRNHQHD